MHNTIKRMAAALSALLLTAAAAIPVLAGPKVEDRLTCEAYLVDTIEVDGKMDDAWQKAPSYTVEKVKTASDPLYYKETMKPGDDYATMTFRVLWNGKDTLYILMDVFDDTPNYTGDKDWYKDSVEFFYRSDNSDIAGTKKTGQYRILADGTNASSQKHPCGWAKTENGYTVEYALDIFDVAAEGEYIGLDFQLNDNILNNGGAAEVYLGWSDEPTRLPPTHPCTASAC